MTSYYFYLIAGIVLIALELTTTTFYLLVIGLASIIAGVLAFFLPGWTIPTLIAGILSVIGCVFVSAYRRKTSNNGTMLVRHIGQSVEVTEVHAHNLRVLYSGSYWNANSKNIANIQVGDKLIISKFSNNEFEVE